MKEANLKTRGSGRRSAARSARRSAVRSTARPTDRSTDRSARRSAAPSARRSAGRSAGRSARRSAGRSARRSAAHSTGRSPGRSAGPSDDRAVPGEVVLAVDIGNTQTGLGIFVDGLLRAQFRITSAIPRSADELFPLLERLAAPFLQGPDGAGRAVIGSVVPSLTEAYREVCRTLLGREPWIVSAGAVRGLRIEVPDPESVGADRVANAVAAAALHRVPAVVVDLGTATNFDVVLPGPRYVGGVIAPGVTSSAEELFRRGARLPKVEIVRPRRALGRTTTECIQSGVYFGAVEQIDGIVRRLRRELAIRPRVIATGGLAESIAEDSRTIQVVDPALTLHGLRILEQRMREG